MKIIDIKGREVLDSRGYPTVEAEMLLENGNSYRAIVPSGASTGEREGLELRDGDPKRFNGRGVLKAVDNINTIIRREIVDKNVTEVDDILLHLDDTQNKSKLGVNAILPVSICAYKYLMEENPVINTKSPKIMCNILNGGVHSSNDLDVQEFMIIPMFEKVQDNIKTCSEIFHNLKDVLRDAGYSTAVGDEGGFSPALKRTEEALKLIKLAIEKSNYVFGKDVFVGLDVAASQLLERDQYRLDGNRYDRKAYMDELIRLIDEYQILSIEDPFEENDFASHAELTKRVGERVMVVGDDLFTTNVRYLQKGIVENACNAILIKPNQIGTIKEVIDTVNLARTNDYKVIFSHRSGDTEDVFIADLAAYLKADYVKFGSMSRSERTAKYNELLRIFENE